MKEDNQNNNKQSGVNPEDEANLNKNAAGYDSKREITDPHHSNVDPLKPQFERNNLQADQEKRSGTGGGAMDPGRREDRQNNGNENK